MRMTNTIRQAIVDSGVSIRQLARRADIDPAQLNRFMRLKQSMTLPKVERLCDVLGLVLHQERRVRRGRMV